MNKNSIAIHNSTHTASYAVKLSAQCLPTSAIFLNISPVGSIMNGGMISDGCSAFFMSCCSTVGPPQLGGTLKAEMGHKFLRCQNVNASVATTAHYETGNIYTTIQ